MLNIASVIMAGMVTSMASSDSQSISQTTSTTSTAVADAFAAVSHLTSVDVLVQAVPCNDVCLLLSTKLKRAFRHKRKGLVL